MARFRNPLDHIRVAAPCESDWDRMIGDERVRFCGQCSLNVYNLSSMTRTDAESLIARTEGRLCVRFYRRRDGSVITSDCPVGVRAIRRRVSYIAKAVSSMVLGLFFGLGVHEVFSSAPFAPQKTMGVMARETDPPDFQGQMVRSDPPAPGFTMGRMLVKPIRPRPAAGQRRNRNS